MYTGVHVCVCVCVCMSECVYVHACVCMCVCAFVCMHVCRSSYWISSTIFDLFECI